MANSIPENAVFVSKPSDPNTGYGALDLVRLESYVKTRVAESQRLMEWAYSNNHDSLGNAHRHSVTAGQQILDDISAQK